MAPSLQLAGVAHAAGQAAPAAGPTNQVQAARAATDKYHQLSTATAAGCTKLVDINGIACIAQPGQGAMGVHYVKAGLVGDPAIRLRQPEALVYRPTTTGLRAFYSLHAWIWYANPAGMFTMWNPRVHC